jgi:hypothetical protein
MLTCGGCCPTTRAMGNTGLEKWGRLLMAMEIRAARKYYHITSASTTFPEPFKSNKVRGHQEAGGAAQNRLPAHSWEGEAHLSRVKGVLDGGHQLWRGASGRHLLWAASVRRELRAS